MLIRRAALLAVAIGLVAAATGVAQARHRGVVNPVVVQFDYWSSTPGQQAAYSKVVHQFEKAYRYIKVNTTVIDSGQDALSTALLTGSPPPDVFEVDSGWFSTFAAKDAGYMQRLDIYARADKSFNRSQFLRPVREAFNYQSAQYAYPIGYTTLGLWYNKPLLAAAGVKSAPTTWKSLPVVACKLTNSSNGVYGLSLSADTYHWFPFLGGWGGSVLNHAGTAPVLDSKSNVNSLNWFAGLYDQGCAESAPAGSSDISEFGAGHAAMTVEPSSLVPSFQSAYKHAKWGVVPLPKGPKGQSDIVDAVGFGINSNSAVKTASWKFVKFLDGKGAMTTIDNASGFIPGRTTIRPSRVLAPFVRAAGKANTWAWPPGLEVNAFPHLDSDIQNAVSGSMTPSTAVGDMQNWLKQYLP